MGRNSVILLTHKFELLVLKYFRFMQLCTATLLQLSDSFSYFAYYNFSHPLVSTENHVSSNLVTLNVNVVINNIHINPAVK